MKTNGGAHRPALGVVALIVAASGCKNVPPPAKPEDADVALQADNGGPEKPDLPAVAPDTAIADQATDARVGELDSAAVVTSDVPAEWGDPIGPAPEPGDCDVYPATAPLGLPCAVTGEIHCSNDAVVALLWTKVQPSDPGIKHCVRRYVHVCEDVGGERIWVKRHVSQVPALVAQAESWSQCSADLLKISTCQEVAGHAVIGLQRASSAPNQWPVVETATCEQGQAAKQVCYWRYVGTCMRSADVPAGAAIGTKNLGTCAVAVSDTYNWWYMKHCDWLNCQGSKQGQPVPELVEGQCVYDPTDGQRCAKTCAEIGKKDVGK